MPGLTGPLFSLGASGTLAKAITYSRWKGVKYARQRVIPANPKSADQVSVRLAFANMNAMFAYLPGLALDSWTRETVGRPLIPRNAFVKDNILNLETDNDYTHLQLFGHHGAMPAPVGVISSDAGAQHIQLDGTAPSAPNGYTYGAAAAAVIKEGTAASIAPFTILEAFDATDPFSIDIDVNVAGTYHWAVTAYAISDTDSSTIWSPSILGEQIIA